MTAETTASIRIILLKDKDQVFSSWDAHHGWSLLSTIASLIQQLDVQ